MARECLVCQGFEARIAAANAMMAKLQYKNGKQPRRGTRRYERFWEAWREGGRAHREWMDHEKEVHWPESERQIREIEARFERRAAS